MRRVLFVHAGAVGDFVVTLPVLEALRTAEPAPRITILGRPHIAALALDGGLADDVLDVDRAWVSTLFGPSPVPLEIECDLCVTFLRDETFERNLAAGLGARVLGGTYQPGEGERVHWADLAMRVLEPIGIARRPVVPRLRPSAAAVAALSDVREPFVAVNPGTGGRRKRWPVESWVETLDSMDGRIAILGGPADGDLLRDLRQRLRRASPTWLTNQPLPAVAGLLSRARAYVGCDSGITHLAAAVGCPTLALFGPTDPERFGPRGARATTLRNASSVDALAWLREVASSR
jgi:ADP-heptose:LPS heptosyltransferase